MQYAKKRFLALGIGSLLIIGASLRVAVRAQEKQASPLLDPIISRPFSFSLMPDPPTLSAPPPGLVLRIASEVEPDRTRPLGTNGAWGDDPHVNVVLCNTSDKPVKIWAEDCSEGNDNLSLEITAINGEKCVRPLVVQRPLRGWTFNNPRLVTLEPGQETVREVHKTDYGGFPSLPSGSVVRMRAVFNFEWQKRYGLYGYTSSWCVVSDSQAYVVPDGWR